MENIGGSRAEQEIAAFDLSSVTEQLLRKGHADAPALETEFRKFAVLCARHRHLNLTPSSRVDDYWHQLVLDTQMYRAFCTVVFGEFVDHIPDRFSFGMNDQFSQTIRLYEQRFGLPDPTIWGEPGNSMSKARQVRSAAHLGTQRIE